jgi:UDP-N-acetylmuramyl pentapeptide phosphotransferase/UDP-N-acetylglucosamine-1-phosphate transferase
VSAQTALALWVGVGGLAAAALVWAARRLNVWLGWVRPNYLGVELPAFCGIAFPALGVLCVLGLPLADRAGMDGPVLWVVLGGTVCFGVVGLADGLWGSPEVRGIAGHLRTLFSEGRLTTGFLKMAVGIVAGLFLGMLLCGGRLGPAVVAGAVIALSANGINLLDTRPGRAPWTATVILAVLFLLPLTRGYTAVSISFPLWPFLIAAEAMALSDRARLSMMGDVGSNSLGAVVGIGLVLATDLRVQLVIAVALFALSLLGDRYSLSAWLDRKRP